MEKDSIAVGIPTFKRPQGLKRLLSTVLAQRMIKIDYLIIADNEGDCEVTKNVLNFFEFENIIYIPVIERGISSVRNAILTMAFKTLECSHLAMVDDDEFVSSSWLFNLYSMQKEFGFDVVGGHVEPHYEITPPKWALNSPIYKRPLLENGQVSMIMGTTNVLLYKSIYTRNDNIEFDIEFGLTGGGDKEFFTRLLFSNARFGFSQKAVSYEIFGPSRLTKDWFYERNYRLGSTDSRVMKRYYKFKYNFLLFIIKLPVIMAVVGLRLLFTKSIDERVILHGLLKRQFGKMNGLFNNHKRVYNRVHGK